ncbi:hypothetical protein PHYSODRAFT_330939 [Phytophthora sojae]|nr:hypothetical protein PHYSODRAFT_330939 [Phytophthora sojae]EGZ16887.1 hypothetical protein PHYSODRAFT_330939 [Phytophthora sojae]|eukprot:XP_009525945.1 hypothetical protein PHYSODRAFT_330939 [Phytophthora sojae]
MPPAAGGPKFDEEAAEIERFRARHRRLHRDQPGAVGSAASRVEALDEDGGRRRKVSAKWRQQQQQQQQHHHHHHHHHHIPHHQSAHRGPFEDVDDAELHGGFNAFDFSASPEAFFHDEPRQVEAAAAEQQAQRLQQQLQQQQREEEEEQRRQHMAHVAQQVSAMGFNTASLWEQSSPCLGMWRPPVQMPYAPHDDQRQCLHGQPQFFA